METALHGDVAILHVWKVDEEGNCQFRYTTRAFGHIRAKAAKITIVEAEHIVPAGEMHPDSAHLPGIYVDRIVPAEIQKVIEVRKIREKGSSLNVGSGKKSEAQIRRKRIAKRTRKELKDGYYVNLGVGIPTLAPSFLHPDTKVWIHSENGLLGMGPYPTEEEIDGYLVPSRIHTFQTLNQSATSSTLVKKL
jgi:3-oxoacid CoA-transferase